MRKRVHDADVRIIRYAVKILIFCGAEPLIHDLDDKHQETPVVISNRDECVRYTSRINAPHLECKLNGRCLMFVICGSPERRAFEAD